MVRNGKILVIGACGQIGTELVQALARKYGPETVLSMDIREIPDGTWQGTRYIRLDACNLSALANLIRQERVFWIFHLAAILSATGEKKPREAWNINMETLWNVLEVARELASQVERIFWPSSIAVFGPTSPRTRTPQQTVIEPLTIYGISKYAGERLCEYFWHRWKVDVRSLRYPGLLSYQMEPGGGTTDYAIEMCRAAARRNSSYVCPLSAIRRLPMMYMEDAIRGTLQLMEAPRAQLRFSVYNFSAFDFTPAELEAEIRKYIPNFSVRYAPDERDQIASQWPQSIDDSPAREDWHWQPRYSFADTVVELLKGFGWKERDYRETSTG